jgi:hypothetical protein
VKGNHSGRERYASCPRITLQLIHRPKDRQRSASSEQLLTRTWVPYVIVDGWSINLKVESHSREQTFIVILIARN